MAIIISKLLILVTVLFSLFMPAEINGAVVADVAETDGVISYNVTNDTGLVIVGDTWVEKLEVKIPIIDEWADCKSEDAAAEGELYVNPGAVYADSYDATYLMPGTYQLTVGYNVATNFDGSTEIGYTTVEFVVE